MTTHDLVVVRTLADRVAVLYQGELCEIGPTPQVYVPPYHPYTAMLLQAAFTAGEVERTPTAEPQSVPTGRGCLARAICPRQLGDLCQESVPPWQESTPGHWIRCHIPLTEL